MNKLYPEYSKKKIIKNVKYTGIGALIILITIVLPAEYNVDITGFGKFTGLNKLAPNYQELQETIDTSETDLIEEDIEIMKPDNTNDISVKSYEYNTLEKIITLPPKANKEIKFKMYKDSEMTFSWESSETVYFDQHGEPTTSEGKKFLPYKTVKDGKQKQDNGIIIAEFTGTHGWYWRNLSNKSATIKLSLSGNFEE
ncbi:MAG: hypothetical protein QM490_05120 [Candidatus Gracilibacteria bacterium]